MLGSFEMAKTDACGSVNKATKVFGYSIESLSFTDWI